MSPDGLFQVTFFTLVAIPALYYSNAAPATPTAEPRFMVESPMLKEVEYKKSLLYNRKPGTPYPMKLAQNARKGVNPTWKPISRKAPVKPAENAPVRQPNLQLGRPASFIPASSAGGGGNVNVSKKEANSTAVPVMVAEARNSTGNSITETAASDRIFIPPYKMPFWGMPYGVYSNGGFINPGLFPFVPGGPGFPPYDGIFGSPFGPGGFPGNQSPFPKGTGTPMDTGPLPMPPMPYGQPPLNPTGRRSNGSPPGAYSPGSQMGYYYGRQARKPKPKKKKPKKPKPEPEPESDGGCMCSKGKDHDHDSPAPSYKRPKSVTTPATSEPCPCKASSAKPSYKKEVMDEDEHYHHHHHDHSDDKYRSETSTAPCPLATPPASSTTTDYVPPPPSTTPYEHPAESTPTTEYTSPITEPTTPYKSRKPCKLKHRSPPPTTSQRTAYYDYDSPDYTQMPTPTKKPCPLKLRGQKTNEKSDYAPAPSPIQPYVAPQPTPVTVYQPAPMMQTQQYQQYQYQPPQYVTHTPQESQTSHSTVLYKPIPQEIIHTPTSVTVPLPFPYVMDSNGMLQPHPNHQQQNSQQVTYKVDLNQDLMTKITTPVVVTQPHQQTQQHQQFQTVHELSSSGSHPQYVMDGHPLSISNSQLSQSQHQMASTQPRVFILDTSSSSTPTHQLSHQSSVNYPSSLLPHSSSSSPSVVVLKSDSLYNYRQQQEPHAYTATSQSPVTVSYVQPSSISSSTIPNYASVPSTSDYSILLTDSQNNRDGSNRHKISNNLALPYRTITSYQAEAPARRAQYTTSKNEDDSKLSNKYVIIDRAELEELKKTFTPNDDHRYSQTSERNLPPPPDVVHIQFHSKMDDEKENPNKPLSFHSENRARQQDRHQQEQPKHKSVYIDPSDSDPMSAEGSSSFSRIFELNNDDLLSSGRRISVDRDKGSNHATIFRTSLVFDKFLKNESERMK